MKTTKEMARLISHLAEGTGIDLTKVGSHARIENPPYMPLCIEVIGRNLVSVTHYYEQDGDLVPDPDMVFFMGYGVENGWVPVHFQANTGYYQQAGWVEGGELARFDMGAQAEQASFADIWAHNLKAQGFLKAA